MSKMITRRQFLTGAVSAAACLTIFRVMDVATRGQTGYDVSSAVGPRVPASLSYVKTEDGYEVNLDGEKVLETNEAGYKLMTLADGSRSLDELILQDKTGATPQEIADFYLTLAQAGWLENRLEVKLYAVES